MVADSSPDQPGEAENFSAVAATMLGSISAGITSRVFCHPLDTCKARLQAQVIPQLQSAAKNVYFRNTWDTLRKTVRAEGISGLYRGFFVTAIGTAPGTCLYLTAYETSRDKLLQYPWLNRNQFAAHFASGMIAEGLSCIIWVPVDVIKERLQVQQRNVASEYGPTYNSTLHAIRTIRRQEGLRGIYKGYWATLLSFGPFSALYFLFYEKLKKAAGGWTNSRSVDDIPFVLLLSSSASAGAMASFLTNPLDLIKLRLQIQRGVAAHTPGLSPEKLADLQNTQNTQYRGVVDGLQKIVRQEGFRALFKGAGARMLFHAPSTAITMALYERFRSFFQKQLHN